jgi:hypothetical protein
MFTSVSRFDVAPQHCTILYFALVDFKNSTWKFTKYPGNCNNYVGPGGSRAKMVTSFAYCICFLIFWAFVVDDTIKSLCSSTIDYEYYNIFSTCLPQNLSFPGMGHPGMGYPMSIGHSSVPPSIISGATTVRRARSVAEISHHGLAYSQPPTPGTIKKNKSSD